MLAENRPLALSHSGRITQPADVRPREAVRRACVGRAGSISWSDGYRRMDADHRHRQGAGADDGEASVEGAPQPMSRLAPRSRASARLETRLAGVVVAALKEAFDRDRARMDLERAQIESERRRARRRSRRRSGGRPRTCARSAAADRHHGRSDVDAVGRARRLAARHARRASARAARDRLALAFAALGCTFAGSQHISAWTRRTASATSGTPIRRASAAATAAPWRSLLALAAHGGESAGTALSIEPIDFNRQSALRIRAFSNLNMITVYGADWCEDTRRSLRHLRRLASRTVREHRRGPRRARPRKALNGGERRTPIDRSRASAGRRSSSRTTTR